ncbi:MAG: hydrogenase maturation nickel metallochaperone HypA [SAR324 cluster bacterium]|uniref:Hydrogenase maturation factor HypA n=1 Tax=SAR324 cluster bacterium TaxID=2024889 RepID=A0A7X9FSC6_9DELT|nr:hydrogenase maturation nickel metallochaperone HypA [SAR324 cluster bacterium]
MHELSLATSLVSQVEALLKEHKAEKVASISVSIGKLSGIDKGALEFCFPLACEGTALEGSKLLIEEIPVKVRCSDCEKSCEPEIPILMCRFCGSRNVKIIEGREFFLESMEVK